uniref:Uncharacterized protein n=1 Tax=Physcomitrium patens TaxID=3218 RepID=A0A2K1IVV2_PHYPA|nr:hypothetical protein PHYPA_025332 [Physcomitrium patens]
MPSRCIDTSSEPASLTCWGKGPGCNHERCTGKRASFSTSSPLATSRTASPARSSSIRVSPPRPIPAVHPLIGSPHSVPPFPRSPVPSFHIRSPPLRTELPWFPMQLWWVLASFVVLFVSE